MTLAELLADVQANVGMSTTAGSPERTRLIRYLNEGVEKVLIDTHCDIRKGTLITTAGVGDYYWDEEVLEVTEINITSDADGMTRSPERASPGEIDEMRRSEGSPPVRYYALDGNLLMLYPIPDSTDTVSIRYIQDPDPMTTDTDDPSVAAFGSIPKIFHTGIVYWASKRAAESDDKQVTGLGKYYLDEYNREIIWARGRVSRLGGRRLAPARLGGQRVVKSHPSQDVEW